MFQEPMDIAVEIWKIRTNPAYKSVVFELAEVGQKLWRARAEELLSLCESYDPTELFEYVEANPPSAHVVAELIKMAMARQKSKSASHSASKSHNEHRAMKAQVFEWLDANMSQFKSMDAAAECVAGKIVPIKWRTARDWIGEWKKLRSASRP